MIKYCKILPKHAKSLSELDTVCLSVPWSYESFLKESKNPLAHYVIAEDGEKVVGYCGYWQVADEGQITNIAVLPEYRRQKIAHKMLSLAIQNAKICGLFSLSLEVRESNSAAISLYEGFGFKRVGCRKNYYKSPNEAAVLMELNLKGQNDG